MAKEKEDQYGSFPLIGEKFPELEVNTTHGKINVPDDYEGSWFVLFSHPGDFTPVCTTEFVSFANRYDQFQEMNTELIGLSIDQVFSHLKWTEWIEEELDTEIPFPIIADNAGNVAKELGMIHPGKGSNTVRAVFVVDDEGVIRTILYYPQELGRNMDEILRVVKGLQTSDSSAAGGKDHVAIPADWPENDILDDEVIVEPASTEEQAEENLEKYDCYDWWLCHRELEE